MEKLGVAFVDIVYCIDCSNSMTSYLFQVKNMARVFWRDFCKARARNHHYLYKVIPRVKIIGYGNRMNANNLIRESDFFPLPEYLDDFEDYLESLTTDGCKESSIKNNGLNALVYAINTHMQEHKLTQAVLSSVPYRYVEHRVIVVWSASPDIELQVFDDSERNTLYTIPANFYDISEMWDEMKQGSKCLLLFTPDESRWSDISEKWEDTLHFPSLAGAGINDYIWHQFMNIWPCDL